VSRNYTKNKCWSNVLHTRTPFEYPHTSVLGLMFVVTHLHAVVEGLKDHGGESIRIGVVLEAVAHLALHLGHRALRPLLLTVRARLPRLTGHHGKMMMMRMILMLRLLVVMLWAAAATRNGDNDYERLMTTCPCLSPFPPLRRPPSPQWPPDSPGPPAR
jgi:hypothetical protein